MIEISDLHKSYDRGEVKVLDGIDLRVERGEFVAISGTSGGGKSTLLHLLAALDRPTSGSIVVNGHDLTRRFDVNRYRRLEVGLVFQLHNLLAHLEAVRNVELAMFGTARDARRRRERARELMAMMGLAAVADRAPKKLSGGERMRVSIARALANDPQLLLADEPTGSLDEASTDSVMSVLQTLRAERNLTLVVVSHDPRVVAMADRQLVLADGRLETGRRIVGHDG